MTSPKIKSEMVFPKNSSDILELGIERVTDGIEITAKSKELEEFFSLSGKDSSESTWNGIKSYNVPRLTDSALKTMLSHWGNNNGLFLDSDQQFPNMSFLRSIGLKEGVKLVLPVVSSTPEINQYFTAIETNIKRLFKDYIKPINLTLQLVSIIHGEPDEE